MKPHIKKSNGLWFCGVRRSLGGQVLITGSIGVGYTKEQAYRDWRRIYGMVGA
jgi:hypothetical protein